MMGVSYKIAGRESIPSQQIKPNGYSLSEILLVFGIIAGCTVGVWTMFAILRTEAKEQAVVDDIRMLQSAAIECKYATEGNDYTSCSTFADLKPYLGK